MPRVTVFKITDGSGDTLTASPVTMLSAPPEYAGGVCIETRDATDGEWAAVWLTPAEAVELGRYLIGGPDDNA